MLFAYQQRLDPLAGIPGSVIWSTLLAGLPVLVLFYLLVPRRWSAPRAGAAAALVAGVIAVTVYGLSPGMTVISFVYGAAFGLLPVGWTIFTAMLLYNITVATGQFDIIRRSVAGVSGDARLQAILIGFAFGAFLEGAAGGGTPVAICGAMMVGLGFDPFLAAVVCLIANTSPVAYGGLGTPVFTLNAVTGLHGDVISVMAGHQLPLISLFVPLYMVKVMCTWKQSLEVWPALLVAGGSFAVFQFLFATLHVYGGPALWHMTDIGGGLFSLVVTAIFLRFWKPRHEWHFNKIKEPPARPAVLDASDPHSAEAAALLGGPGPPTNDKPLTPLRVIRAWMPFLIMSVFLLLAGFVRQREGDRATKGAIHLGWIDTNYLIEVPYLHEQCERDPYLHTVKREEAAALLFASNNPLGAAVNAQVAVKMAPKPEEAKYNLAWMSSPGSPVFFAAIVSALLLRLNLSQFRQVVRRTFLQMRIPIPTIAFMLGLSYITRYAGMDATLGLAFAGTGILYPFFAALLGWLGVFLTGTDAGSNALFGSLQKITATDVFNHGAFQHLDLGQAQVLICTANSTGGVMGKMIDAQSIVVSTAATNQLGREADIFKAVLWHSVFLAVLIGLICLVQAYVPPFTRMVPHSGP
jgi:L-lactate permease